MAKLIILYFLLSLFVACGWSTHRFEMEIIRKLNAEYANSLNFVMSPFAIRQALAMLYLEKESRRDYQLAKGLGITGKGSEQIISHFENAYNKLSREEFRLANQIYYPEKFNLTQHMKNMSAELHVDVASLKLSNGGNEITQRMQKSIEAVSPIDLMAKTVTTDKTKLVAVQGLYVEPMWKHPFEALAMKTFRIQKTGTKQTSFNTRMLYGSGSFSYIFQDDVRAVSIPLSKTDIKLIIVIPANGNTQEVLKNLNKYLGLKMQNMKMHLYIPIFMVHNTLDLGKALESFGFRKVFAKNADFKLNTTAPIFKQLSVLRVKPSEYLFVSEYQKEDDNKIVMVNQPFVFVIKDRKNIYMAGRVDNLKACNDPLLGCSA